MFCIAGLFPFLYLAFVGVLHQQESFLTKWDYFPFFSISAALTLGAIFSPKIP
jgi:hypothetical protein